MSLIHEHNDVVSVVQFGCALEPEDRGDDDPATVVTKQPLEFVPSLRFDHARQPCGLELPEPVFHKVETVHDQQDRCPAHVVVLKQRQCSEPLQEGLACPLVVPHQTAGFLGEHPVVDRFDCFTLGVTS